MQFAIKSNPAEGAARQGTKEFVQFLCIAVGSANELETQLEISRATNMAKAEPLNAVQEQVTRVIMPLHGLIRALKAKNG